MGLELKRKVAAIVAMVVAGGFTVFSSTAVGAAGNNCASGLGSWPCFATRSAGKRVAKKTFRAKRALSRRSRRARKSAYRSRSRKSASYKRLRRRKTNNTVIVYLSKNGRKISKRRAAQLILKREKRSLQLRKAKRSKRLRHVSRKSRKKYNKGFSLRGRHMRVASRSVRTSCFPKRLKSLIRRVEKHYRRRLVVTSGYRSHAHNRKVGGARKSMHVHCKAVDFKVPGVNKYALARYVKSLSGVGGVGTYCAKSTIHMDVGAKRSWNWGCGKRRSRKRYAKRSRARRSYRLTSLRRAKRRSWNLSF